MHLFFFWLEFKDKVNICCYVFYSKQLMVSKQVVGVQVLLKDNCQQVKVVLKKTVAVKVC